MQRFVLAQRVDRAERASSLTLWAAANAAGVQLHVIDDGELAVAAAPSLPGPIFNLAFGFAHLPNRVDVAIEHFERHRTTGWVWADEPPRPDAPVDSTASYFAGPIEATPDERIEDLVVRELRPTEVGAWAEMVALASELPPPVADAFAALEPHLAHAAHHHRFVAEIDGRPVGAASLHTHRHVGWLRSASVHPDFRGRGIQRALIAARVEAARRRGCELIGASADETSASARNLERSGLRSVALRRRYRIELTA